MPNRRQSRIGYERSRSHESRAERVIEQAPWFQRQKISSSMHSPPCARAARCCRIHLATVPVDLPWAQYVNVLKPNGALCIVGASPGEFHVSLFGLLEGQKSIGGSAIGSNAEMREMFHFSAKHAIMPMTEVYPMKDVIDVLTRLRQNRVRYRAVLASES
jgi:D-arabinose 1-dehydrogenase-like Zn-dependent alcohol dehydrogenase